MTAIAPNEAAETLITRATPEATRAEGYYGLPMLKRPLWGWEIALYFFAEGISSGSYIISTLAELRGARRYAPLIRHARYISFATLLPCPPLLIADLGRPERFLHMLRVVKSSSPMNLGAWALTGFSQPVAVLALAQFASLKWIPWRLVSLAGLPFAFFMLAYPGVLLSTTSIPIWARTRFLGPLLGSSSMATAAGTLAIATALDPASDEHTRVAVHNIGSITHACEALAMAGYITTAGPAAGPLTKGRYSPMFRFGAFAIGIALPAIITMAQRKPSRTTTVVSGLLSLAGGLALKWSIVHAGRDSAEDPAMNRHATRADVNTREWLPSTQNRTGVMTARTNRE